MLAEFLQSSDPDISVHWYDATAGLRVCRFSVGPGPDNFPAEIPMLRKPEHSEVLFCQSGVMSLTGPEEPISVEGWDILLMSDCCTLRSLKLGSAVSGILISMDRSPEGPDTLSGILGKLNLPGRDIKEHLAGIGGYALLKSAPWSRSLFAALDSISPERQPLYCVLKTLELMYLLCADSPLLSENSSMNSPGGYLARIVTDMKAYMEGHLEEKLTIESMSHRFNISPTAFKSCFKSLYSQPVHQWLQTQRMKRAAELLVMSPMNILQIAQAVGYEGLSQFNVIFKRQYGMTPRQYKKMSKTA